MMMMMMMMMMMRSTLSPPPPPTSVSSWSFSLVVVFRLFYGCYSCNGSKQVWWQDIFVVYCYFPSGIKLKYRPLDLSQEGTTLGIFHCDCFAKFHSKSIGACNFIAFRILDYEHLIRKSRATPAVLYPVACGVFFPLFFDVVLGRQTPTFLRNHDRYLVVFVQHINSPFWNTRHTLPRVTNFVFTSRR